MGWFRRDTLQACQKLVFRKHHVSRPTCPFLLMRLTWEVCFTFRSLAQVSGSGPGLCCCCWAGFTTAKSQLKLKDFEFGTLQFVNQPSPKLPLNSCGYVCRQQTADTADLEISICFEEDGSLSSSRLSGCGLPALESTDGDTSLKLVPASVTAPAQSSRRVKANADGRQLPPQAELVFFRPIAGNMTHHTILGSGVDPFECLVQFFVATAPVVHERKNHNATIVASGPPRRCSLKHLKYTDLSQSLTVWSEGTTDFEVRLPMCLSWCVILKAGTGTG